MVHTANAYSSYWQVPVHPDDRHKTAFTCHFGCWQFRRMPFGLCNAPATFQRAMDLALSQYNWQKCLVYLDDIIIFSKTFDQHVQDVQAVLSVLQQTGIGLKLKKCDFSARIWSISAIP